MKKSQNIVPLENKKASIAEVRYQEENQKLGNYDPLKEIAIPENFELN